MSHSGSIICPNCGRKAEKNYCSQCGQATHLHDETFVGLVTHFFAHYFHYESKFWQTLKTLCFAPGALTLAYRNKQRMRFVPPMSLYIFVVVVYFILSSLTDSLYEKYRAPGDIAATGQEKVNGGNVKDSSRGLGKVIGRKNAEKLLYVAEHVDEYSYKVVTILPKIFFFLPPVFALFLSFLFLGKRGFQYVDHAVFAFHVHIPVFFILLLSDIFVMEPVSNNIIAIGFAGWLFYCMRAMMVVYKVHWLRALISSTVAIGLDFVIFMILLVIVLIKMV